MRLLANCYTPFTFTLPLAQSTLKAARPIFNASLREGYLPPIWKSAEVVPVPKEHPPTSISGLYHSPNLESIVGRWFLFFIEPHLDNCQFGCRKSKSTTHALIAILHTWIHMAQFPMLLWDFRKAFDLVDHSIGLLCSKLSKYNIRNFYCCGLPPMELTTSSVSGSTVQ